MSRQARGTQTGRDPAGPGGLRWRIVRLEDENAALREQQRQLGQERERLRAENERLRAERERLQEINERLRGEGEGLRRGGKRGGAPVSEGEAWGAQEDRRGASRRARGFASGGETQGRSVLQGRPHASSRRPGRKPGAAYGGHAQRPVPEQVAPGGT